MKISVEKITDERLLRRANSFTTNHESNMSLETAYRFGHSPIRTQLFWVEMEEIPLFVASQFVRSHVGVQFFQLSKRTDRGGADFGDVCENLRERIFDAWNGEMSEQQKIEDEIFPGLPTHFDRAAPTNLAFIINAEALINMAHKRLCSKASEETRDIFRKLRVEVAECDPALAHHLVPTCIFRNGICPEPKSCKLCNTLAGIEWLNEYQKLMKFN